MKAICTISLILLCTFGVMAQLKIIPYAGIYSNTHRLDKQIFQPNIPDNLSLEPFRQPNNLDCAGCYFEDLKTFGIQYAFGFNLSKTITQRFSLLAGMNLGFWKQRFQLYDIRYPNTIVTRTIFLPSIGLNIGQRFTLKAFKKSAIFTETNLNFQVYGESIYRKASLSIEPAFGYSRKISERNELFFTAGYDKFLTNYSSDSNFKIYPGRVNLKLGMSFKLATKVKDEITGQL